MSSHNPEVMLTLDDAVAEVLGLLTGLDLSYDPRMDRYIAITRQLNRALRSTALEHEWSYYSSTTPVAVAAEGTSQVWMQNTVRPRIINDDAVTLRESDGTVRNWAYFLPRDALHKYGDRGGLWVSHTRDVLSFSRPFSSAEDGLEVHVPVMREPVMFRLPEQPEDPNDPLVEVPQEIRDQPIDFDYPDQVILRAAFYYAQTDPVMQPRVQTLEAQYKDMMYQLIERDDKNTESPYINEFTLPLQSSVNDRPGMPSMRHPHADSGWW